MGSKIEFLVLNSLKKKFKSKWFLVVNIILLILMPVICNIDSVIKLFGGEFDKPTNIYVVDNANVYDTFTDVYENANNISLNDTKINIEKYEEKLDTLKNEIKEEKKKDIILIINKDDENIFEVEFVTYDLVDTILYQNLITSLNTTKSEIALKESNISSEILESIYKEIEINRIILNEEANSNSEFMELIGGVLIPIFILPFFFLIILVVQHVGAEINEEKVSKSMEIIISSISPTAHFISKIISTNIFVLSQGLLLIVYGAVGVFSRSLISGVSLVPSLGVETQGMINTFIESGMLTNIVKAIPFIVILIVLSFIACSLIAGILASITTSAEDYQQIQTPLMLILVLGYYLAIMASAFESSTFIKLASYFPLVSSILSPVLLIQGQIGTIDIIISIACLAVLILLLLKYGIKVYKRGILNYSSKKLWSKMFKAIKEK